MKSLQLYDCDRCGSTFLKEELRRENGLLVCKPCYDPKRKPAKVNPKWGSARANATSTAAVNSPTVFSVTAVGGIPSLSNSLDGRGPDYHMLIIATGGALTVVADPPIPVSSTVGRKLGLEGTDNSYTVTLNGGTYLTLVGNQPITFKDGTVLCLVSDGTKWVETSRSEEGFL